MQPGLGCVQHWPRLPLGAADKPAHLPVAHLHPAPPPPPAEPAALPPPLQGAAPAAPKGADEAGGSGNLGKGALVGLVQPGIARLVVDEEGPEPIAEASRAVRVKARVWPMLARALLTAWLAQRHGWLRE